MCLLDLQILLILYKKTVQTLIRRHVLRRLIWVYTVCQPGLHCLLRSLFMRLCKVKIRNVITGSLSHHYVYFRYVYLLNFDKGRSDGRSYIVYSDDELSLNFLEIGYGFIST